LDRRAAHHKAVTIICISLRRRRFSQRSVSLVILEHGLISESERVALETKLRRCAAGVRDRDSGKDAEPASRHRFAPGPKHHIKCEPGQEQFCLRKTHPTAEIFDIVSPTIPRPEFEKVAPGSGATLPQDSQRQNHNHGARRSPARG